MVDCGALAKRFWTDVPFRGRFARGVAWSFIGAATSQAASLGASVITARLLGREGFGQYGIVQSTVGMLGVFAGLGLGMTATKYIAECRMNDPERATRVMLLSFFVAIVSGGCLGLSLLVFAPLFAERVLGSSALGSDLRIGSAILFLNTFNGAQTGVLAGLEAFRTIARINLVRGIATLPISAILVLVWRLPGALGALVITAALTCILSHLSIRRGFRISPSAWRLSSAWSERRVLWKFSAPTVLSSALVMPVTWGANALLVNQPGGYAEMGVFSAALQWRNALLFVPSVIGQVMVPLLSSMQNVSPGPPARRLLSAAILTNALCTLPPLLLLVPCAHWIMSAYGPGFTHRGNVLRLVLASAALFAIQIPVGNLVVAFGRTWAGLFMNVGWAICLLAVAASLIHRGWGADALASALLIAYAAHATWTFWFASRVLHLDRRSLWVSREDLLVSKSL